MTMTHGHIDRKHYITYRLQCCIVPGIAHVRHVRPQLTLFFGARVELFRS